MQNLKIQALEAPEDQGEAMSHLIEIMELGVAAIKGGQDQGEIVTTQHNSIKGAVTLTAFSITQATAL